MKAGDTAYIVESNRIVREVTIVKCTGGLFLIKFNDTGGAIQVKQHRLFASEEEANASIPGKKIEERKRSPYEYWH